MAGAEAKAALVGGPVLSGVDATRPTAGVLRIANTGAAQNTPIPESLRGLFVSIAPIGASIQGGFSRAAAAPSVTSNATGTALQNTNAATGVTVGDGRTLECIIPDGATFFCWIASAAAGFTEIYVSEMLAKVR